MMLLPLVLLLASAGADTLPVPRDSAPVSIPLTVHVDTAARASTRAVEHTDAYYTRLTIHRYGSYAMLPLFGAEYYLGNRMMSTASPAPDWIKPTHVGVALGLGALFTSNTITGVWNLWDSRHDPDGRALRFIHSALLLAADAGFAVAPALVDDDNGGNRALHRNVAIASMSAATLGTVIMWLRKD